MSTIIGPPYRVAVDARGDAVVSLPQPLAETLQGKLLEYGFPSELTVIPQGAALNFGPVADVAGIQRVLDGFTLPPLPVIMGS